MGYELKTKKNEKSVKAFLESVEPVEKQQDSLALLKLFEDITGDKGKMWGSSIVGFGSYTYVNSTGKPNDWMRTGFSPRKQNLTLYIMPGYQFDDMQGLLEKLGPHKLGKSCLYIKRLADIDIKILRKIIKKGLEVMEKNYGA